MTITIVSQEKHKNPTLLNDGFLPFHLTPATFKVMYYLKDMHGKRPTHRYIARRARVCISTVKRALNTLCSLGYLNWETIYHEACIYYLSPEVLSSAFRHRLWSLYSFYFAISLSLIMSPIVATGRNDLLKEYKGLNNTYYHEVTTVPLENYVLLSREHPKFLVRGTAPNINNSERKKMTQKLRLEALAILQKSFPLTAHGIINLKKYPASAIAYATRFLPQCITKLDPYRYFLSICERYCKENKLDIDRQRYQKEREALGILDTDTNFLDATRLEEMLREQQQSESRGQSYLASKSHDKVLKREERRPSSLAASRVTYIPEELPSEEEIIQTRREVLATLNGLHGEANEFVQILTRSWQKAS